MADSYSVKAILSAQDSGFTSTLKKASSVVDKLGSKVGNFGFGILQGAGQAAFNAISNGVRDFVGEMNSSNAAWKTFEGNMKIIGKTEQEINSVKGTLQDYATQTIYSSSDMAGAYSQLAAVGIDAADTLVKGFGGLAGAAEDPAQAMKTLSQQGVQMAAKPKVAWQDFKLMLEQTPAGMAAVAKEMGMTTSELVTAIQDGEVATNDFFDAVKKVGNSKDFTNLATQYKTVGQAMDGLKETLANKLNPAFDVLSQKGISAISGIIDKLGEIDGQKVADSVGKIVDKVEAFGTKCKPYIDAFIESFSGVRTEVLNAFTAIKDSLGELTGEFGSAESVASFKGVMQGIADAIKSVAQFCTEHADGIAKFISFLPQIAAGLALLKIGQTVAPAVQGVTGAIGNLLSKVSGKKKPLEEVGEGIENAGNKSSGSSKKLLASAKAFALMGVGVLAVAVGFALLAQSAIALSNAGGLAIGVMAGLVVALAAVGVAMGLFLKSITTTPAKLTAAGQAMLMMGAAVLLVSVGFAILAQSSIALAGAGGGAIAVMFGMVAALAALGLGMTVALKSISSVGTSALPAAAAMLILAVAVVVIAAGFAILAASAIALAGAGGAAIGVMFGMVAAIALLAVGAALLGSALTAGAVGFIAFGAAVLMVGAGFALIGVAAMLAATALTIVAAVLPQIAASGLQGAVSIAALGVSLYVFAAGAAVAGVAAIVLGAGLLLMGAGVLMAGTGMLLLGTGAILAATALTLLAAILPVLVTYGTQGAAAIAILGAGLIAFGAGALVAGAAAIVLGAGLAAVGVGIAVVGVGVAVLAVGVAALAVGLLVAAVAILAAAGALAVLGLTLPQIAANGTSAAAAMVALSAGLLLLGAGALVAAAGASALGAGLVVATVGVAAFGAAMLVASAGVLVMAAALKAVASQMKTIASSAKSAEQSLNSMQNAVNVVESGLNALGAKAQQAMNKITTAFNNTASKAQSAGQRVGNGFTTGMQSGLAKAPGVARSAVSSVCTTLSSGYGAAYSAGSYISQGFAAGMMSCLGQIRSAAAQMVAAANAAITAKARIASPSKVTTGYGEFYGEGFEIGIESMYGGVKKAAQKLVAIPNLAQPKLAHAYGGGLSSDYEYSQNAEYTIISPVTIDGREVAKATATYTQSELNKNERRESRKKGKV